MKNAVLDYERKAQHILVLRVDDQMDASFKLSLTVNVVDVNDLSITGFPQMHFGTEGGARVAILGTNMGPMDLESNIGVVEARYDWRMNFAPFFFCYFVFV